MKTINLDDWTLFSARRNSDNYFDADKKTMLKVFNQDEASVIPLLEKEKRISDYLAGIGIKTPAVLDMYRTDDGRIGMTYENIKNKKSLSRAISEDNSLAQPYMELLAEMGKQYHSHICSEDWVPSYKELLAKNLPRLDFITPERREDIRRYVDEMPDDNVCMHGDFQPGNFIVADGTVYAIDVADLTKGCPVYDISMFHNLAVLFPPVSAEQAFHWSKELALKCWGLFTKAYFGDDVPDTHTLSSYGFVWIVAHWHLIPPRHELLKIWVEGEHGVPKPF